MGFYQESVGTCLDGRSAEETDEVPTSHRMGRVNDDGLTEGVSDQGDAGQIQEITGVIIGALDAPLTKDDMFRAGDQQVFSSHHPFMNRCAYAPFQENGFAGFSYRVKERKILHISRTYLDNINASGDRFHRVFTQHF